MFLRLLLLLPLLSLAHSASLSTSNDDVAIELLRENQNLIFLFGKIRNTQLSIFST